MIEKSQTDSVEGVLTRIFQLVNTRDALFSKDLVFDLVLNLKMVARESKHPKAGYYSAVLQALREKMAVSDVQFRRYITSLLGDKDQEEVCKKMAQVDKAEKSKRNPDAPRGRARFQPYQAQCYLCQGFGHFQRNCYLRQGGQQGGRGRARGLGPQQ